MIRIGIAFFSIAAFSCSAFAYNEDMKFFICKPSREEYAFNTNIWTPYECGSPNIPPNTKHVATLLERCATTHEFPFSNFKIDGSVYTFFKREDDPRGSGSYGLIAININRTNANYEYQYERAIKKSDGTFVRTKLKQFGSCELQTKTLKF